MAEALSGLVQKVIFIGDFVPFKVNENIYFEILQFIDDPILLREA